MPSAVPPPSAARAVGPAGPCWVSGVMALSGVDCLPAEFVARSRGSLAARVFRPRVHGVPGPACLAGMLEAADRCPFHREW